MLGDANAVHPTIHLPMSLGTLNIRGQESRGRHHRGYQADGTRSPVPPAGRATLCKFPEPKGLILARHELHTNIYALGLLAPHSYRMPSADEPCVTIVPQSSKDHLPE